MHREAIIRLIEACRKARGKGAPREDIYNRVLAEQVASLMKVIPSAELLEWLKKDREYNHYYYDAEQSGVCAKPREAVALILESIVRDAIE